MHRARELKRYRTTCWTTSLGRFGHPNGCLGIITSPEVMIMTMKRRSRMARVAGVAGVDE